MRFENENDLYRTISTNIKRYREKANLTQVQLAELSGLSTSYISKIEASGCNKSFSIAALNQIANALNANITDLFIGEN